MATAASCTALAQGIGAFRGLMRRGLEGSKAEHQTIKNQFLRKTPEFSPYKIFDLPESATKEEIKKKYRDLCKEHHPDKVIHLGPEFKEIAEQKMREINRAYDEFKKWGKV